MNLFWPFMLTPCLNAPCRLGQGVLGAEDAAAEVLDARRDERAADHHDGHADDDGEEHLGDLGLPREADDELEEEAIMAVPRNLPYASTATPWQSMVVCGPPLYGILGRQRESSAALASAMDEETIAWPMGRKVNEVPMTETRPVPR